jgi:hypothetical protein
MMTLKAMMKARELPVNSVALCENCSSSLLKLPCFFCAMTLLLLL